ncbi:TIM-barrel domain-containing protein [Microbacter margulisiae]|uniref:Alpha-glucosidase (Family GH31 glycosyl hydrolase) n=1 Tax=Microbacter margulisiae TaxID=1350067 RepID=A0A7W5DPA4_9PORP|nr:TIM-barrel domain-containing protein [Microbacter margulisiae]MBB3186536.1 alpha-glucosidase (family GH31 glycosyl hydrolase) [Microbacter margulisiae]
MRKIHFLIILLALCFSVSENIFAQLKGTPQTPFKRLNNIVIAGNARFEVLSPTLVRMEYSEGAYFINQPSVVVVNRPSNTTKMTVKEANGHLIISTDNIKLKYLLGSGKFTKYNLNVKWIYGNKQGEWMPGDSDTLNLGGLGSALDQASVKLLPSFTKGVLSKSGYFLLDDSHSAIWDKKKQWIEPRSKKNLQDWYFFSYGDNYSYALLEFSRVCGKIPMIPRYVLGTWITDLNYEYLPSSKLVTDYHYTDENLQQEIEKFRHEGLPLDVLVLDFGWHKFGWEGGYDWSPIFPHPKSFLNWAHKYGLHIAVNDHPGYGSDQSILSSKDSQAPKIRQLLHIKTPAIGFNLTNKLQANIFMKVLHAPIMKDGVDFWWIDGGGNYNWWQNKNRFASMSGINSQLWTNRLYYEYTQKFTGKRSFIISRYGGWGSERYPAFFTGDTHSEWPVLAYEVSFTARAGNVLMPYVTHDIGGFLGGLIGAKMYCRWLQFGVFSPIMRLHCSTENPADGNLRMPWVYGKVAIKVAKKFLNLREQLIPYLYTYTRIAYEKALPIVRPLYLTYPNLPEAYKHSNEYLFGNDFLVAPITDSLNVSSIYFPPGKWIDYFTGKTYIGGQSISDTCSLTTMPLFVKEGAIIPMQRAMSYSAQRKLDTLMLDIYGPRNGRFNLYEDDGMSLSYKHNAFAWTTIRFTGNAKKGYNIIIDPAKGVFEGQLPKRAYIISVHGLSKPVHVSLNGKLLPSVQSPQGNWTWNSQEAILSISVPIENIRKYVNVSIK